MTQDELEEKLKLAGFPVQYHHFSKFVEPPYIVYLRVFDENIAADLSVLGKIKHYQVELYSAEKDTAAEKKLERILNTIDTDYSTSEQYIK
ncbi:MAG TPA: hypothetical protein DCP97_04310, partial [Ruminococcaceae bacterium]|nr:hypothetical protein [Oscillospiraceae bacterium]